MKKIILTPEKLIEKIDNYKTNSRVHVIYLDIMDKKILDDKELLGMMAGDDAGFECGYNVFFIRDTPIIVYKALLEKIRKHINDGYSVNILFPSHLVDFNTNTEYYVNDDIITEMIKNMKL